MAGPVIPDRYRAALGDDDPFLAMFEAPQALRRLLKGLTEKQLSRRPAPGKWSIKEIVAHLAERGEYVKQAARFKKSTDDVRAPQRVEQVIGKAVALAGELGANPHVTEQVYRAMKIIRHEPYHL